MDLIEQQSRNIFLDLMNMDECVVLLDEMDALLRDRESLAQGSVIEFVVPAFLPKLQQLRDHAFKRRMAVFFVTNYYETIDRAISRAGRIDIHTLILPYNKASQLELITGMLTKTFKDEPDKQRRGIDFVKEYIEDNSGPTRLVTYREAEQLSDLIVREIENGTTPSSEDLADWATSLSITPDIYAKRGVRAYKEVCAVIGRVLNENEPSSKYTTLTMEDAKTFLKNNRNRLGNSAWYELSEKWIKLLGD